MATWKGEDDPRLVLARRLYKETHDADMVAQGMRSLGYGREESFAAAAHVAGKTSPRVRSDTDPRGSATGQAAPRGAQPSDKSPTPPGEGGLSSWFGSGPKMPRPTLQLPRRPTSTQVVGFGLGMVAYVLVITYLRYGPDGVKGWFGAKLLNVPYTAGPDEGLDGSGQPGFGNPSSDNPDESAPDDGSQPLTTTRPQAPTST